MSDQHRCATCGALIPYARCRANTCSRRCQDALARATYNANHAAPSGPLLPRRIAADYCRCCGGTAQHWPGCDGGAS